MIYQFSEQLRAGLLHEDELIGFLCRQWEVTVATMDEQRRGIDLHLKHKDTGKKYSVEIKSDSTAAKTGNAFIETVSVSTQGKPGWAYTCSADLLFYYIPPDRLFYILRPSWIKRKVQRWVKEYPMQEVKNASYSTVGLLVPLSEFEGKQKVSIAVSF